MNFDFIGKYWDGKERLWKAFWLFGVLGGAILSVIQNLIGAASPEAASIFGILVVVYSIWNVVSIWRCAYNVNHHWLGHLARAAIIIQMLAFVFAVGMIVGGFQVPGQIT